MAKVLSTSMYRCLVGHLMYWERGLEEAMTDCGIPLTSKGEVVGELFAAGYDYDEEADKLICTV